MPKPDCRNLRGFVSLPLVLVTVAVVVILLVAYILTKSSIGIPSHAQYPKCSKNSCAYQRLCHLSGKTITVGAVSYTCEGGNYWADPTGKLIAGDANGPILSTAKPTAPIVPSPTAILIEPTLASDNRSGCLLSLRFDRNDVPDPTLKAQAKAKIDALAALIKNGQSPQSVLSQILPNTAATAVNDIWSQRGNTGANQVAQTNPYEIFQTEDAPNLCYTNSSVRHERLGSFFYEANPQFQKVFQTVGPGQVSEPFVIYRLSPSQTIEYAWTIIVGNK